VFLRAYVFKEKSIIKEIRAYVFKEKENCIVKLGYLQHSANKLVASALGKSMKHKVT